MIFTIMLAIIAHIEIRIEKILIFFDNRITDINTSKRFQSMVSEILIRCRKLNISIVFNTQACFPVPKDVRLNSAHYLIVKIHKKRELQNIAINHSADIDHKDFMKIYRECTNKLYCFLTIDTTLPSDNPLIFRNNFLDAL